MPKMLALLGAAVAFYFYWKKRNESVQTTSSTLDTQFSTSNLRETRSSSTGALSTAPVRSILDVTNARPIEQKTQEKNASTFINRALGSQRELLSRLQRK
ncbi:MAG: hypothetical protein ACTHMM_13420 [Agriterribacter sp.]